MEARKGSKAGIRKQNPQNKNTKRKVRTKRNVEKTGNQSEKKNFSSRNIHRITKKAKMEGQNRESHMYYSKYDKKQKSKELIYKFNRKTKASPETVKGERASVRKEKEMKKGGRLRVKTTRVLTQGGERTSLERETADWISEAKGKNLERELSMSDNQSKVSGREKKKKTKITKERKGKGETVGGRKRPIFSHGLKNKSQNKLVKKVKMRTKKDAKYQPFKMGGNFRMSKTPRGKKVKLGNQNLIQKEMTRPRTKTFQTSSLLESDGFKRSHKKNMHLKSTRNVPRTEQRYFVNSMNNIPLGNYLPTEIKQKEKKVRGVKKSKSKSISNGLKGFQKPRFKNKYPTFKEKFAKISQTFEQKQARISGVSLGDSNVSSKNKLRNKFQKEVIPSPLSRKMPKSSNFGFTKQNHLGKSHGYKKEQNKGDSPDLEESGNRSQVKFHEKNDPHLAFKKPGLYRMSHPHSQQMFDLIKGERRGKDKSPRSKGQGLYLNQEMEGKLYSKKNLKNPQIISMVREAGTWQSQRNSQPELIELIKIPVHNYGNFPQDKNQFYFEKSHTIGNPIPKVRSHLGSFGEFPGNPQPYDRFMHQRLSSKQFIETSNLQRNNQNYFERGYSGREFNDVILNHSSNPQMYNPRKFRRGNGGMPHDNQNYVYLQRINPGGVWVPQPMGDPQMELIATQQSRNKSK